VFAHPKSRVFGISAHYDGESINTAPKTTLSCAETRHEINIVKIRPPMWAGRDKQRFPMLFHCGAQFPKIAHSLQGYVSHLIHTWFLGPTRLSRPKGISIGSSFLRVQRT